VFVREDDAAGGFLQVQAADEAASLARHPVRSVELLLKYVEARRLVAHQYAFTLPLHELRGSLRVTIFTGRLVVSERHIQVYGVVRAVGTVDACFGR